MNVLKGRTRTGTEDKHVMYTNTGTWWFSVVSSDFGSNMYVASITVVITEQFMKDKDRENMFYIVYRFTKGVVKLPVITDIQYIYACTELIHCKEGVCSSTMSGFMRGTHRAACDCLDLVL